MPPYSALAWAWLEAVTLLSIALSVRTGLKNTVVHPCLKWTHVHVSWCCPESHFPPTVTMVGWLLIPLVHSISIPELDLTIFLLGATNTLPLNDSSAAERAGGSMDDLEWLIKRLLGLMVSRVQRSSGRWSTKYLQSVDATNPPHGNDDKVQEVG